MKFFVTISLFLVSLSQFAQLKLPSVFGNDMVLQQNENVALWGKDTPNTKISLETSWGVSSQTTTNENGDWATKIKTPLASFNKHTLRIKGTSEITFSNVLIGEVWFCSGQSNMEMPLKGLGKNPVENAEHYINKANNQNIRLFNNQRASSLTPSFETTGSWIVSNLTDAQEFSAIGFMFGAQLYDKLQVPIGIIESSWGGTIIETWLPKESASKFSEIKIPEVLPAEQDKQKLPTALFNAMINPFNNFTIKGVLWYQGEGNVNKPKHYKKYSYELVNSWRKQWNNDKLPFYFVQITPYGYAKYRNRPEINANLIREIQVQFVQEMPYTGVVITGDVGNCSNIHPSKKEPIAERLVNYALAEQYQFAKLNYKSPTYEAMEIEADKIILTFNFYTDSKEMMGFKKENQINGFQIAGEDQKFYPAKVTVNRKNQIVVQSDAVDKPIAVRYGFEDCFDATLFGKNGLPVSIFRTDNWN